MTLLETAHWTSRERAAFEQECFRNWLNKIDAWIDYELRRTIPLKYWRELFDAGECENDAIRAVFGDSQVGLVR
jgi:hypothetical protein